jgi:hypothetical protein
MNRFYYREHILLQAGVGQKVISWSSATAIFDIESNMLVSVPRGNWSPNNSGYYQMRLCCIWSRNAENSPVLFSMTFCHVFQHLVGAF